MDEKKTEFNEDIFQQTLKDMGVQTDDKPGYATIDGIPSSEYFKKHMIFEENKEKELHDENLRKIIKKISDGTQLPLKEYGAKQTIYNEPAETFLKQNYIFDEEANNHYFIGRILDNEFIPIGYRAEVIYKELIKFIKNIYKEDHKKYYTEQFFLNVDKLPSDSFIDLSQFFKVKNYNGKANKIEEVLGEVSWYDNSSKTINFDVAAFNNHIELTHRFFMNMNVHDTIACIMTRIILHEIFHSMHPELLDKIPKYESCHTKNDVIIVQSKIIALRNAIELFTEYTSISFFEQFFEKIMLQLYKAGIPMRTMSSNEKYPFECIYKDYLKNKISLLNTINYNFLYNVYKNKVINYTYHYNIKYKFNIEHESIPIQYYKV